MMIIITSMLAIIYGCTSESQPATDTAAVVDAPTATALPEEIGSTITPSMPTATLIPVAARVNGEAISLSFYESELARFQAVAGTGLATYGEEQVIVELIDQVLLAQSAAAAGFIVDEALIEEHIQQLELDTETLTAWMSANHYTLDNFFQAMRWSIAAAWMRDQIVSEVPDTTEQVHARQILLYNLDEADRVYAQLESGADFETLATEYDPLAAGGLGWFPRGYLFVPELETVIFELNPGEYSPIIPTFLGYHIAQLIERDPNRPLAADTYRSVQLQVLQTWLTTRRNDSEIIVSLP